VYYTDVFVRRTTMLERILPFTRPDGATVVPEHALLPPGITEDFRDRQVVEEMERSEEIASLVALRALDYDVDATPTGALVTGVFGETPADGRLRDGDVLVAVDGDRVRTPAELRAAVARREPGENVRLSVLREGDTKRITIGTIPNPNEPTRPFMGIQVDQAVDIDLPIEIDIDLGRVGGPSAGLPFALEIVRLLGEDVTGGCVIAATGALAFDGTVISVGAIPQKTIGAQRADVDAFLVPAGRNADEARSHADGLRIIPVESFQQALRTLATDGPKC
jgi:PDZ domain-containing protein